MFLFLMGVSIACISPSKDGLTTYVLPEIKHNSGYSSFTQAYSFSIGHTLSLILENTHLPTTNVLPPNVPTR